jgi:hypothetical protein
MGTSLASADVSSSPQTGSLRGLLLGAVLLPAVVAGVDYALLEWTTNQQQVSLQTCLQFGWYVVQVGIVGWVVGSAVSPPALRWIVFGWVLLLINLLTFTHALSGPGWDPPRFLLPAALLAGQIGLCTVWAFFGDTRWPLRWPAMALLAAGLFWFWAAFDGGFYQGLWNELLVLQVLTLAALCGLLRLRGFRLGRLPAGQTAGAGEGAQRRVLQFNIKHVLTWTTALAAMLGVARGLDLLTWEAAQQLVRGGIVWKLTVAATSAIAIIVAIWVALGSGHWLSRYAVGLAFALLTGTGLALWSKYRFAAINAPMGGGWRWNAVEWQLREMYEFGWWWLGWLFLCSGLLAATLIILRVLDYRLVKTQHGRLPR